MYAPLAICHAYVEYTFMTIAFIIFLTLGKSLHWWEKVVTLAGIIALVGRHNYTCAVDYNNF